MIRPTLVAAMLRPTLVALCLWEKFSFVKASKCFNPDNDKDFVFKDWIADTQHGRDLLRTSLKTTVDKVQESIKKNQKEFNFRNVDSTITGTYKFEWTGRAIAWQFNQQFDIDKLCMMSFKVGSLQANQTEVTRDMMAVYRDEEEKKAWLDTCNCVIFVGHSQGGADAEAFAVEFKTTAAFNNTGNAYILSTGIYPKISEKDGYRTRLVPYFAEVGICERFWNRKRNRLNCDPVFFYPVKRTEEKFTNVLIFLNQDNVVVDKYDYGSGHNTFAREGTTTDRMHQQSTYLIYAKWYQERCVSRDKQVTYDGLLGNMGPLRILFLEGPSDRKWRDIWAKLLHAERISKNQIAEFNGKDPRIEGAIQWNAEVDPQALKHVKVKYGLPVLVQKDGRGASSDEVFTVSFDEGLSLGNVLHKFKAIGIPFKQLQLDLTPGNAETDLVHFDLVLDDVGFALEEFGNVYVQQYEKKSTLDSVDAAFPPSSVPVAPSEILAELTSKLVSMDIQPDKVIYQLHTVEDVPTGSRFPCKELRVRAAQKHTITIAKYRVNGGTETLVNSGNKCESGAIFDLTKKACTTIAMTLTGFSKDTHDVEFTVTGWDTPLTQPSANLIVWANFVTKVETTKKKGLTKVAIILMATLIPLGVIGMAVCVCLCCRNRCSEEYGPEVELGPSIDYGMDPGKPFVVADMRGALKTE